MSNSIDVSVPNVTQILCFFGHSMLNSNKVAVAVSLTFGSILANTLGATTGLVAASTAYLLTKYFHVKFENANAWKLQKETELNLFLNFRNLLI